MITAGTFSCEKSTNGNMAMLLRIIDERKNEKREEDIHVDEVARVDNTSSPYTLALIDDYIMPKYFTESKHLHQSNHEGFLFL